MEIIDRGDIVYVIRSMEGIVEVIKQGGQHHFGRILIRLCSTSGKSTGFIRISKNQATLVIIVFFTLSSYTIKNPNRCCWIKRG